MSSYQLLYDGNLLGTITEEDSDFPTVFGSYALDAEAGTRPGLERAVEYVEWCVRTWPLIEQNRYDEVAAEEDQFMDLIESDGWVLRADDGREVPILIPVFCTDNKLNWRYAFRRDKP